MFGPFVLFPQNCHLLNKVALRNGKTRDTRLQLVPAGKHFETPAKHLVTYQFPYGPLDAIVDLHAGHMDDKRIKIDWARNSPNPTRIAVGRPGSCGCHADQRPKTLRVNFAPEGGSETVTKRLPGCDQATLGSELAIFLSLGLL